MKLPIPRLQKVTNCFKNITFVTYFPHGGLWFQ
jgi:hypothetical protein